MDLYPHDMRDGSLRVYSDYLKGLENGPMRLGDIANNSRQIRMSRLLGLDSEVKRHESMTQFLTHQYGVIACYSGLPEEGLYERLQECGHDIRALPADVDFDGPFGRQKAFGAIRIDGWISKYVKDMVFFGFLGYADSVEYDGDFYMRRLKDQHKDTDLEIDIFLERGRFYQPCQLGFFLESREDDTIYTASDLRRYHLDDKQASALYENIIWMLEGLIYSEIFYNGGNNPFAKALDNLLHAAVNLDPDFTHPFAGESTIYYFEGDDQGYFPPGYWAENPIHRQDPVLLRNCRYEGMFLGGEKGIIIGARNLGHSYFATGELALITG